MNTDDRIGEQLTKYLSQRRTFAPEFFARQLFSIYFSMDVALKKKLWYDRKRSEAKRAMSDHGAESAARVPCMQIHLVSVHWK